MAILETALPILNLTKASVSGIGIPGVEGAINAVVELATMVSSNKNDLSKLEKCLDTLISIDASGCGEDLKNRLITLKSKLSVISVDCGHSQRSTDSSGLSWGRNTNNRFKVSRTPLRPTSKNLPSMAIFRSRSQWRTWHRKLIGCTQRRFLTVSDTSPHATTPKILPTYAWKAQGST
ncbi:hypothetical protein B0H13DRAFT_447798 [Mycena leptocephala]|nr:hypothetical protein B0H13DRAFT_447798 [Mycena leptocephala]